MTGQRMSRRERLAIAHRGHPEAAGSGRPHGNRVRSDADSSDVRGREREYIITPFIGRLDGEVAYDRGSSGSDSRDLRKGLLVHAARSSAGFVFQERGR